MSKKEDQTDEQKEMLLNELNILMSKEEYKKAKIKVWDLEQEKTLREVYELREWVKSKIDEIDVYIKKIEDDENHKKQTWFLRKKGITWTSKVMVEYLFEQYIIEKQLNELLLERCKVNKESLGFAVSSLRQQYFKGTNPNIAKHKLVSILLKEHPDLLNTNYRNESLLRVFNPKKIKLIELAVLMLKMLYYNGYKSPQSLSAITQNITYICPDFVKTVFFDGRPSNFLFCTKEAQEIDPFKKFSEETIKYIEEFVLKEKPKVKIAVKMTDEEKMNWEELLEEKLKEIKKEQAERGLSTVSNYIRRFSGIVNHETKAILDEAEEMTTIKKEEKKDE